MIHILHIIFSYNFIIGHNKIETLKKHLFIFLVFYNFYILGPTKFEIPSAFKIHGRRNDKFYRCGV